MVLFDSNIFIYGTSGKLEFVVTENIDACYASVSIIEVLGYHRITAIEERKLRQLLSAYQPVELSDSIIQKAVELRQSQNMSLGDAIVASTALEINCELWTVNVGDFKGINGLVVYNPLERNVK